MDVTDGPARPGGTAPDGDAHHDEARRDGDGRRSGSLNGDGRIQPGADAGQRDPDLDPTRPIPATAPTRRRSDPPALRWGAASHTGRTRPENEDNFAVTPNLFVVADGMGGHAAGEVASEIAVTVLEDRLSDGASSIGVVVAATIEANASIFHEAHADLDQRGMGTTITGLVVLYPGTGDTDQVPVIDPTEPPPGPYSGRLAIVNVGDSRTYVLRHGHLRRMTIDHSYVQELLATGHITEHEARAHPRRNIVTRALGIDPTVRVDSWVVPLVLADRFIVCSDGLVDEVDDTRIAEVASAVENPQDCAEALVEEANRAGGRDNITVLVVDVLEGQAAPDYDHEPPIDLHAPTWLEDGPADEPGVVAAATSPAAVAASPRQFMTPGRFLFWLAIATIATVATVLGLVALRHGDTPPTTTTTTTSTTVPPTTSTSSTTSTSTTSTTVAPAGFPPTNASSP